MNVNRHFTKTEMSYVKNTNDDTVRVPKPTVAYTHKVSCGKNIVRHPKSNQTVTPQTHPQTHRHTPWCFTPHVLTLQQGVDCGAVVLRCCEVSTVLPFARSNGPAANIEEAKVGEANHSRESISVQSTQCDSELTHPCWNRRLSVWDEMHWMRPQGEACVHCHGSDTLSGFLAFFVPTCASEQGLEMHMTLG